MKAIRKSDGEVIDVEAYGWDKGGPGAFHTNFKIFYKPEDLDFNIPQEPEQPSSFDWKSFRNQAAKDILCALLNGNIDYHGDGDNEMFVLQSIGLADELIKQLKEKEA